MWTTLEHPPQPFGECTLCKRHNCGEYQDEDGVTRQKWLHTPLEMDKGGKLVIGYQCAKSMSDGLEITKTVIERPILLNPTDEQIADYIRRAVSEKSQTVSNEKPIEEMSKDELKKWLKERNIEFVPQWGEDKLRELAMQHA